MKTIIIKLLHFIRKIFTVLKYNCLPSSSPPFSLSPYDMFTKEQIEKCFNTFKPYFLESVFLKKKIYHKYIIEKAKENDTENNKYYLEFGVWRGKTINFFSKYVNTIYGFDSFEGLKEDWAGHILPKGHFNLNKKLPKLNKNIVPIAGWVQDTLSPFLEKYKPKINFIHMDLDTYESTKYVLTKIKPFLIKGSIIAFDELYNYPGWAVGEYKALIETFDKNEYKFICFCRDGLQVAIQKI